MMNYGYIYQQLQGMQIENSMDYHAHKWQTHSPVVRYSFRRIKALARSFSQVEYELAKTIAAEIRLELTAIEDRIAECSLLEPKVE